MELLNANSFGLDTTHMLNTNSPICWVSNFIAVNLSNPKITPSSTLLNPNPTPALATTTLILKIISTIPQSMGRATLEQMGSIDLTKKNYNTILNIIYDKYNFNLTKN